MGRQSIRQTSERQVIMALLARAARAGVSRPTAEGEGRVVSPSSDVYRYIASEDPRLTLLNWHAERASPVYVDYKLVVTVRRGAFKVNQMYVDAGCARHTHGLTPQADCMARIA